MPYDAVLDDSRCSFSRREPRQHGAVRLAPSKMGASPRPNPTDRSRRGRSPKVGGGQASMVSSNINLLNTSTPSSQHMSLHF